MAEVNLDMAREFLAELSPYDDFHFRALHPQGSKTAKPYNISGTAEECLPRLEALNQKGYGIFVVVNGGGHKSEDITEVRALFADYDDTSRDAFELAKACPFDPTYIVQSSEGKYHFYWIFDTFDDYPSERVQRAGAADLDKFISHMQSDPKANGLPRLMRLCGFNHTKGEPYLTHVVHQGQKHGWSRVGEWLEGLPDKPTTPPPPPNSNDANEPSRYAQVAMERALGAVFAASDGSRNDTLNTEAICLATAPHPFLGGSHGVTFLSSAETPW
ncbi:MAG: hypothetical protein JJ903_15120 [Spongiibacter sp.]|uniref:DNA-primase RepB domain-containing protein n=1 Tax=Spongiibacter TaxID=630749 RepID=UPI001B04608E|nr:DNA-primase RepB domain-containing protein [Spongiibacter sp.]MBO6754397.1 hypothetical protein [Spongiibacter sp.]